jgi:hypothetical protein
MLSLCIKEPPKKQRMLTGPLHLEEVSLRFYAAKKFVLMKTVSMCVVYCVSLSPVNPAIGGRLEEQT